jgi:hypothetical protein
MPVKYDKKPDTCCAAAGESAEAKLAATCGVTAAIRVDKVEAGSAAAIAFKPSTDAPDVKAVKVSMGSDAAIAFIVVGVIAAAIVFATSGVTADAIIFAMSGVTDFKIPTSVEAGNAEIIDGVRKEEREKAIEIISYFCFTLIFLIVIIILTSLCLLAYQLYSG